MQTNNPIGDALSESIGITTDESFKSIVRYKAISALLVKYTIPAFRQMKLADIAKLIVDHRDHGINKESNDDILNDTVDVLSLNAGTKDEKQTIMDFAFMIDLPKKADDGVVHQIRTIITVNTEMQRVTSKSALGYNLVSRAVYYAASLLRGTVPPGDSKYTDIHKVYSIWFCDGRLDIPVVPELGYHPIHKYGLRRSYDEVPDKAVKAEEPADLMEVIMVELGQLDHQAYDEIIRLFYNTSTIAHTIESSEDVHLNVVRKEIDNMVIAEETIKKREMEAEQRGKLEGEVDGKHKVLAELIKNGTISLSDVVNLGGIDKEMIERYVENV